MQINFFESFNELNNEVSSPDPAKKHIPNWYTSIKNDKNISNIRWCMPFLDSFSIGYTQCTWSDINITKNEEEKIILTENSKFKMLSSRDNASVTTSSDYHKIEFLWNRYWIPSTPEGYSLLITHPFNRLDLPFTTLTGVVDTDVSLPHAIGAIPFYLKKNFIGVIPKGTPMFQMIPIKREEWDINISSYSTIQSLLNNEIVSNSINLEYKKKRWNKKIYR